MTACESTQSAGLRLSKVAELLPVVRDQIQSLLDNQSIERSRAASIGQTTKQLLDKAPTRHEREHHRQLREETDETSIPKTWSTRR